MAKQSAALRQRGAANATTATQPPSQQQRQQDDDNDAPLSTMDKVQFYVAQHAGLAICGGGVTLLGCGYDRGWMNNTHLCLLCLVFCLIGLLFHELRPYNAQKLMEEQQEQKAE